MVTFEEALKIVIDSTKKLNKERVEFINCNGRVLAEDVRSDIDIPSFDKSAMDGYACRMQDLENELTVLEVIPAGKKPQKSIAANECSKIMTGSLVPEGADCVIMVEYTENTANNKIRFTKKETNKNIRYKGEDIKEGDIVLKEGTIIKPQHIAVFASVGCISPLCYKIPKIAVISTGDELVEPSQKPDESHIRNSNAYQLVAQINLIGAKANYYGICPDDEKNTFEIILKSMSENDIVILTGGVSEGDFDFVPDALKKANIDIKFDCIAVQPGRPTLFGIKDSKYFFGLPGNPVSSFVQFELLVKPLVYKLMGDEQKNIFVKLPLAKEYYRKRAGRKSFIPVFVNSEGMVFPVEYHGSAHIHSYIYSNGMMEIEENVNTISEGEKVNVRLL